MNVFAAGSRGLCPHCRTIVRFEAVASGPIKNPQANHGFFSSTELRAPAGAIELHGVLCPACGYVALFIRESEGSGHMVWPLHTTRNPVPVEVPAEIAADYTEAARVLAISPKASAALSRRCLQHLLRDRGYTQHDLAKQIDAALPNLPSHIAESIDAIRNTGNFAAHPMKSTSAGTILDVEPGEAEWNLDVLDMLFDFYYVQPELVRKKREALNAKLVEAGKPPLK